MNIGAALKDIRENAVRKTQMDVYEATGVSQTYLSQIENGKREPSREIVTKLCEFYNVPEIIVVWKATEKGDISDDKRAIYDKLAPILDDLVHMYLADV